MRCTNCNKRVLDALYCCNCGFYMGIVPERRKRKKRANGQGTIARLPHRKKPYRAQYGNVYLGYFATVSEAEEAIVKAKGNKDLDKLAYTMQDVYNAYTSTREWGKLSKKYQADVQSSWNYMVELHDVKAASVTSEMLQDVLYRAEDEDKSLSHQQKLRVLIGQLCQWCRKHELHRVDYAEGLSIDGAVKGMRNAFADEDLAILYKHRAERVPGILWFLCTSGCRLADLAKIKRDERIDYANHGLRLEGSKTRAGRERYVPLDSITWALFSEMILKTKEGESVFRSITGATWDTHNFRAREFYPCLAALGIQPMPERGKPNKYTLYSVRHTFATLSDRSGISKGVLQQVMGHVPGSTVTDDHYIHDHEAQAIAEYRKLDGTLKNIVG